ncbi:MAG: hypothetical protein DRP42_03230 [Tenericutes bacterium]|nr:MAG: hypothetical protein DRP42_03230 [Mycoplasmatota bacterium]
MIIKGYDIIIIRSGHEAWVMGGWKNGRLYKKLPKSVKAELRKRNPNLKGIREEVQEKFSYLPNFQMMT